MGNLIHDIRFAVRMLLKNKGFAVVAVIAVALGIGANSAMFTVINAVLLRPLPYHEPERLVTIWEESPQRDMYELPVSLANYRDWVDQNTVFEQISAYTFRDINLSGTGEPERLFGVRSSANLFSLIGAVPLIGRPFLNEEDKEGGNRVVILSHALWQRRFGSDSNIVGQPLTLNNQSYTIVGVMPAGFQFPVGFSYLGRALNDPVDLYVPIAATSQESRRGSFSFFSLGRLKAGVTIEQARAEMTAIEEGIVQQYLGENSGIGISLVPTHEQTVKTIRPALLVLLGAVAFLLLIACTNIANLLLARAASREKEIVIRTALGASRSRILRLLLTESVILSLTGGCLGFLLALWGTDALMALAPDNIPRMNEVGVDAKVFGFTLLISLITGIVFGLIPAIHGSKTNLNEALKEGSRGSTGGVAGKRIRNTLVAVEVALSLVLLIGAGLMIRSFSRLNETNLGFNPDNVVSLNLLLSQSKYPEDHQQVAFFQATLERLQSLSGVQSVGATTGLPLTVSVSGSDFRIEGRPEPEPGTETIVSTRSVSPGYFRTLGIKLMNGREFSERDTADAPAVAIINSDLARTHFPNQNPLGTRITFDEGESWITIAGVVDDVKQLGLDSKSNAEVYFPYPQATSSSMTIVVRTATNPMNLVATMKSQIQEIDKDLPVAEVNTMEQLLSNSLSGRRFNMMLLTIFAIVALLLAAVGIFGVMSYSVSQRTHEIGIRMALGARASEVLSLVLRQGMLVTLVGLVVGVAASLLLTRLMAGLLFEVTPTDPITFVSVSVILAGVALGACFVPARRAARVDPMVALRYE